MKKSRWTEPQLREAVRKSKSIRQVFGHLGLREAGGNYAHIKRTVERLQISTEHFSGMAWNKGLKGIGKFRKALSEVLTVNSAYQSYKLKKRLIYEGLKKAACELCGWSQRAPDGRIPLELDHINGEHSDNRFENLRILCPNCHSLQATHRGLNKKKTGRW